MLEELKKKTFKKSLVGTIMLIIIGAVLTVISIMKVSYVTFEDLEPDEIKNQSVTIDVTADFGCYLEEYSENTSTHRRTPISIMSSGQAMKMLKNSNICPSRYP